MQLQGVLSEAALESGSRDQDDPRRSVSGVEETYVVFGSVHC